MKKVIYLRKWDENAFVSLLEIYRATGKKEKYLKLVQDYIAIDYANNFLFSNYFSFVSDQGVSEWDRELVKAIAAREFKNKAEEGAVFFNLGRFAELTGKKQEALKWYQKAVADFSTVPEPPDGAIAALQRLIANLSEGSDKKP